MAKSDSKNINIEVAFPLPDIQVWQRFMVGLRYENRFTLEEEPRKFISSLLEYAEKYKVKVFEKKRKFYRARINGLNNKGAFNLNEMGAPHKELAGHGRLNPAGIPYLYLSSSKITAVSEVRPWVGGKITVAEFNLEKDVRLINFSNKFFHNESSKDELKGHEFTWRELISWMFSSPFDPRDDTAYVPTQYLSERIKGIGYDGILYDSALNPKGFNITLFDTNLATPVNRQVANVRSIELSADYKKV